MTSSALAGCRQSGCPVPPLTTTRPRILSIFLKVRLSNHGVEFVLQVAGEEFASHLSILNNAISDTIATKGMCREIFFQSVFFWVRRRLLPSCRACRSWVLLQLLTRSSNNGRPLFPSSLSSSLFCFFLSSPSPHPPPCKHPSLCPRILFSVSRFESRAV